MARSKQKKNQVAAVAEGIEARDMLGHSSVTVTERYAHLAPGSLHDAAAETTSGQQVGNARHTEREKP